MQSWRYLSPGTHRPPMGETMAETLFEGWRKLGATGLFNTRQGNKPAYAPEELLNVLQNSVIPELRSNGVADQQLIDALVQDDGDCAEALAVHQLALLALHYEVDRGLELLANIHARGVPRHKIYSRYLAGAARLIGEQWLDDRRDFAEVTLATGYLQQLVRESSLLWNDAELRLGQHHRILLMPAGKEQHTFGLSVLGELFHDDGWDVNGGPKISDDELARMVTGDRYDVVGFSIATERQLEALAREIAIVRRNASDDVRVLVGGHLFAKHPELGAELDADCTALEGQDVVELARASVLALASVDDQVRN